MTLAPSALTSRFPRLTGGATETGGWLGNLSRAWTEHKAYRGTLAELRALDNRALEDLGFIGLPLTEIVRKAVHAR